MGDHHNRVHRWTQRAGAALVGGVVAAMIVTGVVGPQTDPEAAQPTAAQLQPVPVDPPPPAQVVLPEVPAEAEAPEPVRSVRRAPVGPPSSFRGSILGAPAAAVVAYQRAEAIINATVDCRLDWLVLAAIARVESDHGRGEDRSHRLTRTGQVRPAFVGAPLDGKKGQGRLSDTDRGKLDRNRRWDAPIGPLGLLPTVWSQVAVDADGDTIRNPQDVDDAALGAAVLLCAGGGNLSRPGPLQEALASYHRGKGFVGTVLALVRRYDQQESEIPPYVPPPGGVTIPQQMPEVCRCPQDRVRPARAMSTRDPDAWPALGATEPEKPGRTSPDRPVKHPAEKPTTVPTEEPTDPTEEPTDPTEEPTDPTEEPTDPTEEPTDPTEESTEDPTGSTEDPTPQSTDLSSGPASEPVQQPTGQSVPVEESTPTGSGPPETDPPAGGLPTEDPAREPEDEDASEALEPTAAP